jgi:hypothetical protein
MSDPQDPQAVAEATDEDELDPAGFPPDRPLGVPELVREDVALAGEQAPDSLADRKLREEPEVWEPGGGRSPADDGAALVDAGFDAGSGADGDTVGELAEEDPSGVVLSDAASGTGGIEHPAEEAAVHVVEVPGGP